MKPLSVVHLKGTQAEMGHQYGLLVKEHGRMVDSEEALMGLHLRLLKDANHRTLAGRATGLLFHALCNYGTWRMSRNRPQAYRERNRTMFQAAGYAPEELRHMVGMDIFQNVVGLAGRYHIKPLANFSNRAVHACCSSIATWGEASTDGALRHARNFDFPAIGVWEERPTLVYCDPDEGLRYGYIGSFGVDVPGTTGFNEAGLTVAAHTRFHRDVRFDGAAIMDVCHDIIRRAETLADAVAIANERPVGSTWGILVASASEGRAAVIETTGQQVCVIHAGPKDHRVTCTNLHRHADLVDGQVIPFPAWTEHADNRERRLRQVADQGPLGAEELMDLLGDNIDPDACEVKRTGGGILAQAMSVTSVVYEPEAASMLLSLGDTPTGWGPYVRLDWDWDQPVGLSEPTDLPIARERRELSGAQASAYSFWRDVSRVEADTRDEHTILNLLHQAIASDPNTASYRLLAGIILLRQGDWSAALSEFKTGKDLPQSNFRRGQFLLWGSRALAVLERHEEAQAWRDTLLQTKGPHLFALHELAEADARKPVPARALRTVVYNVDLIDAALA